MRASLLLLLIVACSREPKQAPPKWALAVISNRAGPCSVADPPCKTTWVAQWFGEVMTTTTPNGNDYSSPDRVKSSTTTFKQLSREDLETLTELVFSAEFRDGMTSGFPCQGTSHDPEGTLQFLFAPPAGSETVQYIDNCTRGPYGAVTLPAKILTMLR